jgi:SAM-dependent methyltransferase
MFAQSLQGVRFTADDSSARAELAAALRQEAVDPLSLVPTAVSLLKHTPGLLPLLRDDDRSDASTAAWYADPLLGAMLENALIADWDIENALRRMRAHLLATSCPGEAGPAAALDFAAKLAQQCLLTDHVYEESAQDAARLEALQQKLEVSLGSDHAPTPQQVLAYACYRPLTTLRNADRLRATHPVLAPVLAAHLDAPREEARLRATLPRLGAVNDAVSQAVQAQYESHPYPRWVRVGMQGAQPLAQVLHAIAPRATLPAALDARAPQVLVAGCGTGRHPIQTATRIKGAQVLAVDLSGASLGYAMRKARKLAVANLEFMQADILELGQLERRFDLIESFGVLHHMHDPEAGWRVLCGLAKPGALMVIGLYSERARAPVVACRAQVRERGYGSDAGSIRRFRQDLMRDGDPQVAALIRNSPDFYSVSDCRDLLFHVQEHRYTLPQIAAMGERLGLNCLGLELDDRALYAADGGALPEPADLAGWDRYEQAQPQAFGSTYKIWWQKPA